jgi:hypothetical protein
LGKAILSRVNLSGANLYNANLYGAILSGAILSRVNLSGANLYGAILSGANLSGSNLYGSNLSRANLSGANLSGSDLYGAELFRANLSGANLSGAIGADLAIAHTRILPEGALIGWKKASQCIVKLRIPEDAKRSHAFGRKCRAEFVDVIEVFGASTASTNEHGPLTKYIPGERVYPDSWDDDWKNECSHGIHFYLTRIEAENH